MRRLLIIIICIALVLTGCSSQRPVAELGKPVLKQAMNDFPVDEETNIYEAKTENVDSKSEVMQEKQPSLDQEPNGNLDRIDPEKLVSKRKTSYDHFNTICFAVVYDDFNSDYALARFEKAWQEINDMLTELEKKVSVNIVDSDIYKFNEARYGETVPISKHTAAVVKKAIEMYRFTNGAYNPAVANLVDLWGFSPRFLNHEDKILPYDRPRNSDGSFELPKRQYIDAFKALSDFSGVKLYGDEGSGYYLTKNVEDIEVNGIVYTLKVDLGGIAKGYGADMAAEILKKHGYEYGYVNLGLSSMKLMKRNISDKAAPGDNMWSINMSNPNNPSETYLTGFGRDEGVSTSGTYEVKYTIDGREYSHIIDSNTGEPTQSDIVSVSIWGGNASDADALSTALIVMGKEKASEFIKAHLKDYSVALIVNHGDRLELVTNIGTNEYILNK